MKVSDYIASRLARLGVQKCFLVTGGGAMHLNDAFGACPEMEKIFCHHEQAASIAAEAYARIAGKPALVNVTAGPGGINALNGVFGAFTDSIPMVVISGQVKRETSRDFTPVPGLRQLGDQEVDIVAMATPVTKWACLVRTPEDVPELLDKAFDVATSGRPGPVWVDVPVDIQGAHIPDELVQRYLENEPQRTSSGTEVPPETVDTVLREIANAKRPVILAGTGIRIAGAEDALLRCAERLQLPVTTAWTHDIIPSDHPLFAGRPGTIGTRAGNFVVQNADLVLILGSRLNIRQVSYNWPSFARHARKIWVDIDPPEFRKPFVKADIEVAADLGVFLGSVNAALEREGWEPRHSAWVSWCRDIGVKYSPRPEDYPVSEDAINAYHFIGELFERLRDTDVVVCGDATATIVPFQIGRLRAGMRLFSNSGCASMGYDIPAALGAAVAARPARIICLAGDGSSMMNLQELQTISALGLNVVIFILNNDGYLSIKQTQRNFFGREAGASSQSGLSFPDFEKVGAAFGFRSYVLGKDGWKDSLAPILAGEGPLLCSVQLDLKQEFEPRLKSKMVDGVISTPELDDMYPFLDPAELEEVRRTARCLSTDA